MYDVIFDEYGNIDFETTDNKALEWFESMFISLPRYDDGDLVSAGDLVQDTDGEIMRVHHIEFSSESGEWSLVDKDNRFITLPVFRKFEEVDSFEKIFEDARADSIEDYWGCNSDINYVCADCPNKINGMTPAELYGTDDCEIAIRLDLLMRLIYFWLCRNPEEPNKGESECRG